MGGIESLRAHYDRTFGAKPSWSREENGLAVLRYLPRKGVMLEPTSEIFVTAGMSDRAMKVPDPETPDRVELMVACPGNWKELYATSIDALFVVDTLRTCARFPFEHQAFLGHLHTLPAGRPLAPQTEMAGWVLTTPLVLEDSEPIPGADGLVHPLLMTPLYLSELAYARAKGTAALMDRLFSLVGTFGADWSFLLRPKRPDTVAGHTLVN
jgi:hypothetical protein